MMLILGWNVPIEENAIVILENAYVMLHSKVWHVKEIDVLMIATEEVYVFQ
jgi:hypothetical protein